jgi:hypothetical protein
MADLVETLSRHIIVLTDLLDAVHKSNELLGESLQSLDLESAPSVLVTETGKYLATCQLAQKHFDAFAKALLQHPTLKKAMEEEPMQ